QRADDYMTEKEIQSNMAEYEQKIKQMTAELNVKNDIIRSLSLDINCMNQEVRPRDYVISFTKRHQSKSGRCLSPTQVNDNSNMQHKLPQQVGRLLVRCWSNKGRTMLGPT
ncbi:uncharacterized protein LOC131932794, partial [Physella acuta]|uniref:uncharacterized protein LOC131932794 n=1 Tax=Physella acuta TaxID=109671 RepID=UPI0027DBC91E